MTHVLAPFAILLAALSASADDAAIFVSPSTIEVDAGVREDLAPRTAFINVHVRKGGPWALTLRAAERTRGVRHPGARDPAEVRIGTAAGEWRELRPGRPVSVGEGAGGDAAGDLVSIPVSVLVGEETPPGEYFVPVRLDLSDGSATERITLRYRVAPRARLVPDARPFELAPADPSSSADAWSEARHYRVVANAPWRIVAEIARQPRLPGTEHRLEASRFLVRADGKEQGLDPSAGVTVAAGGPTDALGREVPIEIGMSAIDHASAGSYDGEVRFRVELR